MLEPKEGDRVLHIPTFKEGTLTRLDDEQTVFHPDDSKYGYIVHHNDLIKIVPMEVKCINMNELLEE